LQQKFDPVAKNNGPIKTRNKKNLQKNAEFPLLSSLMVRRLQGQQHNEALQNDAGIPKRAIGFL
jgi:hypothetical protein